MDSRQLEMARKAGIHFPTILPLFDSPPDQKAMDEWVNAQIPELKEIAKKIVKNINYINFEKFMVQLQATINDFNERCKEPYVLWIAQPKKESREGCSDSWVASLALEYCGLRWPEAIVHSNDLAAYIVNNPKIKNFLLLDDAAYSGCHISDEFQRVYINLTGSHRVHSLDTSLFIGIPYMTQGAKERIANYPLLQPQLLKHAPIKQMKHMFEKEELAYLQLIKFYVGNMGLTYFAHRFPDTFSILQNLLTGQNLIWGTTLVMPTMKKRGYVPEYYDKDEKETSLQVINTAEEWNKLAGELFPKSGQIVRKIVPPYYLEHERGKDALAEVLNTTTHGDRTSHALPERCGEVRKMLSDANIAVDGIPFQIPKVSAEPSQPEEKQIQSDPAITSPASEEKEENTLEAIESAIKNHTYILGRGLWSGRCIEDKGKQYKVSTSARDIFNLIKNARTNQAQSKINEGKIAGDICTKLAGKLNSHNGFFCMGARDESTATLHRQIFQIAHNINKRLQR